MKNWHRITKRYLILSILFVFFISFTQSINAADINTLNNSCIECHEKLTPFTKEESKFNDIRLEHIKKNISCSLECHEDIIRKTATDNFHQWSESEHSKYYVTCDDCHGGNPEANSKQEAHNDILKPNNTKSPLYFKNIPSTCGKCHTKELESFKNTMHYQRLRGLKKAPSCITCHRPHYFNILDSSGMIAVCSLCHNKKSNIAISTVPKDAQNALEKQEELEKEILRAETSIENLESQGKDVSSAKVNLEKAKSIKKDIPTLWHGFNLRNFDKKIQTGIDYAKKANILTSNSEPTQSSPGFDISILISVFVMIYLIRKW